MTRHDAFNGDADGLCALQQLRLAEPAEAVLVTGLKRDIELLARVAAQPGDEVTVLDVSLARNRAPLLALLADGVRVRYFDHHDAGDIPRDPGLVAVIETAPEVCTSMLVDRHLGGRFRPWAVVGAFGDNLEESARRLARLEGLDAERLDALRELGETINYNAYGDTEADVLVPPAELHGLMRRYADPFTMIRRERLFTEMGAERRRDLVRATTVRPRVAGASELWMLPDAAWSRRVSGTLANRQALLSPSRACAVVTPSRGAYRVSVRTPCGGLRAADFCRRWPTGGGRALAAGIDRLEPAALAGFVEAFAQAFAAAPVADRTS